MHSLERRRRKRRQTRKDKQDDGKEGDDEEEENGIIDPPICNQTGPLHSVMSTASNFRCILYSFIFLEGTRRLLTSQK
jgi:hypothetical protein